MNIRFFALWGMVAMGAGLVCCPGAGAENAASGLADKAFSDPALVTPMPEDWVKKPITYEPETATSDLTIVLDQDIFRTFIPLIRRFAQENKLKVAAIEGTCGIAAGKLGKKQIDMGGFCCPAGKEDRLPGIRIHTIGIVAKALLVHPDNPVDNLTIDQARDVFRGKIRRWSELKTPKGQPGPNRAIRTIGRFHCKARPGHWYLLLPDEKMFSPMLFEVGSIPDMIAQVAANRDAIGWEVLTMVDRYKETGRVRPLRINGHPPTDLQAIASLKYPLYRVYNVTTWEGKHVENPHALKLVKFLLKEAESLDSAFGFVPAAQLRKSGWQFKGDELVGTP